MEQSIDRKRIGRFLVRSGVGVVVVAVLGAGFALLVLAVQVGWEPLLWVNRAVVASLNDLVSARPALAGILRRLTDIGSSSAATLIFALAAVWLLARREPRLAVYVVVTGLGVAVLDHGVKELVARARPVIDVPLASAAGNSFPSGHTLAATVAYGVVALLILPATSEPARRVVLASAAGVAGFVGFTRIALGVHYLSDVLAGWLLGLAWLGVTATAFQRWRAEAGRSPVPVRRRGSRGSPR